MIENKFLYFQTENKFREKLNAGDVDAGSIVFVKNFGIWTHGSEFPITEVTIASKSDISNLFI